VINAPAMRFQQRYFKAQTLIYATIRAVKIERELPVPFLVKFYHSFGSTEVVDLSMIRNVVGRVPDRRDWVLIDRSLTMAPLHTT
jgi:hypothetical protein